MKVKAFVTEGIPFMEKGITYSSKGIHFVREVTPFMFK